MQRKKSASGGPHARRSQVAVTDLVGSAAYDYADAFEIDLPADDTRSPEQLFRAALDEARWVQRWVPIVHRRLLRFSLGPRAGADHILGWRIVRSDSDVIHLEASGPVFQAVIVGRSTSPSTRSFTTFVFYRRRILARIVWALVAPLHRRVARYLLERAFAAAPATALPTS